MCCNIHFDGTFALIYIKHILSTVCLREFQLTLITIWKPIHRNETFYHINFFSSAWCCCAVRLCLFAYLPLYYTSMYHQYMGAFNLIAGLISSFTVKRLNGFYIIIIIINFHAIDFIHYHCVQAIQSGICGC